MYHFNAYSSVLESDEGYIFNAESENVMFFVSTRKPDVEFLFQTKTFDMAQLSQHFQASEIEKMMKAHNILPGAYVEKAEHMLNRQEGFFSLLWDDAAAKQEKIRATKLLVLGCGAIGTHVIWNMVALGIEDLTILDFDTIELSNLNRQLFYSAADVGKDKVDVIAQRVQAINPSIKLTVHKRKIEKEEDLVDVIAESDFVVKAIDTPSDITKWINSVCVQYKKPYIAGGFLGTNGFVSPIYVPTHNSYCLECVNPNTRMDNISQGNATLAVLTTTVASKIVSCILKIIVGEDITPMINKSFAYNFMHDTWETRDLQFLHATHCPKCQMTKQSIHENKNTVVPVKYVMILSALNVFVALLLTQLLTPIFGLLAFMLGYIVIDGMLLHRTSTLIERNILNFNYSVLTGLFGVVALAFIQWQDFLNFVSSSSPDTIILNGANVIVMLLTAVTVLFIIASFILLLQNSLKRWLNAYVRKGLG
jgi:molybdopterin/thiamine biosynthesis adenylyltransferase